jgi:drug/metabolite transporter (DMT)-like permease
MVLAGACSFGILSTFVKLVYRQGYTAAEISFSQAFLGMLVLWALLFLRGKDRNPTHSCPAGWAHRLPVLLTGVAIGLTTFVYYLSVQYISASLAIVILMQFTWIGMLLDWLLSGHKPSFLQVITTSLILAGTVLASGVLGAQAPEISIAGVLYALAAALLYAVYIVANSRVGSRVGLLTKSALIMTGSAAGVFLVNAPYLLMSNHFDLTLLQWAAFLALFGTIIPPVLFATGIPKIGAGVSAILMTAELPVAVACSHLILGELVAPLQWLGIGIMLAAMMMHHARINPKGKRPLPPVC